MTVDEGRRHKTHDHGGKRYHFCSARCAEKFRANPVQYIDKSQAMRNIRQNLFLAMVYNALGVPIAAGVLFPLFGILLSPMLASLSSVSVIVNALRLRRGTL